MTVHNQSARDLVTDRLVQQAERFPQLDLSKLETANLSARDAGLARAIEQAVMRRWTTLATVVDACLDQSWDVLQPAVKAPLLAGSAQLLLLDRLPDHAVISEAVEWMKSRKRGAAGLVNAVLRKVAALRAEIVDTHDRERRDELPLHDGRAQRLTRDVFAERRTDRLAEVTSCSPDLIFRWTAQHSAEIAADLAYHALVQPPVILSGIDRDDDRVTPHSAAGHVVYTGAAGGLPDLLSDHAGAIVQDPSAAAAVRATSRMSPRLIIDVCAGRGTKTRQLAQLHSDARIVAADVDRNRLAELERELGDHPNVVVHHVDELTEYASQADLVLLDVPCSNCGVLARRPEARYRFSNESLQQLAALQKQIVADSLRLRGPDGSILYTTCSIDRAENEDQVAWISKWHQLEARSSWSHLPVGAPGGEPREYRDGGFFALLRPV